MTCPGNTDDLEHPRDAAHWFARMHSGEATEEDRRAFAAWRAADPMHEREYRRLGLLWDATLAVPEQRLRGMMAAPGAPAQRPGPSRRRVGLGLAAACSVVAAAGIAGKAGWLAPPLQTLELATRRGERRQFALPDGSVLDLNTDTRAMVSLRAGRRQVELLQGEAFFDVRPDPARPFVVEAGPGRITVTGTRFNVRREAEAVMVSVQSGSVRVQAGPWWDRAERRLDAGQQAVAHAREPLSEVREADVGNIVAWQRGKVIFNNAPLAQIVDEMNRYLAQPVRLDAPGLRQHRVSGVFSVDDPGAMIDALPAIAPVQVVRLADGQARILPQ